MAKENHLISVGRLRDSNLQAIERDYLKRLQVPTLKIHEVKASSESPKREGESVLKKISSLHKGSTPWLILLAEGGELYDSRSFSKELYRRMELQKEPLFFILGGAEGHSEDIVEMSKRHGELLSLSPLTFPHQLARILFIEQYYRAQTIYQNHPYHN